MEYATKDFYLSCVFLANGFKLINSKKDSTKNTVFFYFDVTNKEELKNKILNSFINQECLVNVKKFTWAMKILRSELSKYK
jgi:hypothetical protein